MKVINSVSEITNGIESKQLQTNPEGDGTVRDHIGFGVGVNIEDRLRVDAVIAEDLPFTFGNIFSGSAHHVVSRISATFSF